MKKIKILFFIILLALMTTISFADDMDNTTKNHQQAAKKFIEILNEQWGIDKEKVSGKNDLLNDFGADSLDITELVMAVEESFDIEITDAEWAQITTVDSAVDLIIKKIDRRY